MASVAGLLSAASLAAPPQVTESRAQTGEIFVEVFDQPAHLEEVRRQLISRHWRVDCLGYGAAQPFLRVQLPSGATYNDIEYVNHLPGRSNMRMVYETQPKEPCPGSEKL
jgi:hypothetical protein